MKISTNANQIMLTQLNESNVSSYLPNQGNIVEL